MMTKYTKKFRFLGVVSLSLVLASCGGSRSKGIFGGSSNTDSSSASTPMPIPNPTVAPQPEPNTPLVPSPSPLPPAQESSHQVILKASQSHYQLDFGSESSDVKSGAHLVTSDSTGAIKWQDSKQGLSQLTADYSSEKDWVSGVGNQSFNVYIPHGTWTVRMTLGGDQDISSFVIKTQSFKITEEAINIEANKTHELTFTVESDGQLQFDIESDGYWALRSIALDNNKIAIDAKQTVFKYDLGAANSPLENGWTRLTPETWGDVFWHTGVRPFYRTWGELSELERDVVYESNNIKGKLSHKLPNGRWQVEGGATAVYFSIADMNVSAEGQLFAEGLSAGRDKIEKFNFEVDVTDGFLDLVFESKSDERWGISYLTLKKIADIPASSTSLPTQAIQSKVATGSTKKGNEIISRSELDDWQSIMVISKEQIFTNSTPNTVFVDMDYFNFYAQQNAGALITPFVVKFIDNATSTVVAIGDTVEGYSLGENQVRFSTRRTSPVELASGESLAFGFMAGRADGSGASGNPVPYNNGGDTIVSSGGPKLKDSAKLTEWSTAFVPGSYNQELSKTYSYAVSFTPSSGRLLGNAENASLSVAPIRIVPSYSSIQNTVTYFNHIVSDVTKPFYVTRENNRYGGKPYDTNIVSITTVQARQGNASFVAETIPVTGTPKQRVEFVTIDRAHWRDDDTNTAHYYSFSFRFDSSAFGQIEKDEWFNILQFNQNGTGVPGSAIFHQVVKLNIAQGSTPSLIKLIASPTFGVSKETPDTFNGNYRTFDVEELEKDQWYDLILGIRMDVDGDNGFSKVWIKRADETEYRLKGYEGRLGYEGAPSEAHASFGIYKKAAPRNYRIYYDEIRQGPTFESVDIRNHLEK